MPSSTARPDPVARATAASAHAARLAERERVRSASAPLALAPFRAQFRLLIDKVMGEAGLHAPEHAALALKHAEGDAHEAVVFLRAFRSSLPRRHASAIIDTRAMLVRRRISSAFREIPGGQILGPTLDYSQRLLSAPLAHETLGAIDTFLRDFDSQLDRAKLRPLRNYSKVTDLLRAEGLIRPVGDSPDTRVQDVTREPLAFPAPRSARLQSLARAETGALMALAYSGMRGQGGDHPTIGEVRVGLVAITVTDTRGRARVLGRIEVTEAENISKIKVKKKDPVPYMSIGYGLCFGQNETKAICMGMLDRAMRIGGDSAPAISQEFVLYHTEGADAYGAIHALKLADHTDFQNELDLLRQALARHLAAREREASAAAPRPSPTESACS